MEDHWWKKQTLVGPECCPEVRMLDKTGPRSDGELFMCTCCSSIFLMNSILTVSLPFLNLLIEAMYLIVQFYYCMSSPRYSKRSSLMLPPIFLQMLLLHINLGSYIHGQYIYSSAATALHYWFTCDIVDVIYLDFRKAYDTVSLSCQTLIYNITVLLDPYDDGLRTSHPVSSGENCL